MVKVIHQGRGGFIEVDGLRFDIEMQTSGPSFAIHFPRKRFDKLLMKAKKEIKELITNEPKKWELAEFDGNHGLYDAMTVNERLFNADLLDDYDNAINAGDKEAQISILRDVEVPEKDIERIVKNA